MPVFRHGTAENDCTLTRSWPLALCTVALLTCWGEIGLTLRNKKCLCVSSVKDVFKGNGLIWYVIYLRTSGCYSVIQTCSIAALVSPDLVRLDKGPQIWQKFCRHVVSFCLWKLVRSAIVRFSAFHFTEVNIFVNFFILYLFFFILYFIFEIGLFFLLYWLGVKNQWLEPDSLQRPFGQICSLSAFSCWCWHLSKKMLIIEEWKWSWKST